MTKYVFTHPDKGKYKRINDPRYNEIVKETVNLARIIEIDKDKSLVSPNFNGSERKTPSH